MAVDPFIDEVIWLHWAVHQFDPSDSLTFWLPVVVDGRPPLYFWLSLITTMLADNAFVGGRLAAALPDIGSTVALYFLGRLLFSVRVGFFAGVLWALSPFSVFFARIASDDPLLTFCVILVALAGVLLVRYPGIASGTFCGLAMGLAVMSKTLGVLAAVIPVLAILTLASRPVYPRLFRPVRVAVIVSLVVLLPLVPWVRRIFGKAAHFAEISSADTTGLSSGGGAVLNMLIHLDVLGRNSSFAYDVLSRYIGLPILLLAALAVMSFLIRRERAVAYLTLIWAVTSFVLLDRATLLFSRYLLFPAFPLYLLAAWAIVSGSDLIAHRMQQATKGPPSRQYARAILQIAGLTLALGPVLPSTGLLVVDPERVPIPSVDRFQHFEQFLALHGIGRVAKLLQDEARSGPVTVLVPPHSDETLLPSDALMLYLRGTPSVHFREVSSLRRPESLCDLRSWLHAREPAFFVTNGTTDIQLWPVQSSQGARDTRRLEIALARDLSEADLITYLPRMSGASWLKVYRVDQPPENSESNQATMSENAACLEPQLVYLSGWQEPEMVPGANVQVRWMFDRSELTIGPLPRGWYRPLLWARPVPNGTLVSFRLDGIDLGHVIADDEHGLGTWLESPTAMWIADGQTPRLELEVHPDATSRAAGLTQSGRRLGLVVVEVFLAPVVVEQ